MAEYEQTLTVRAEPAHVLDFIADVGNMPKYLPTTKSAQLRGPERVRVQGEANDQPYDSDGYLRRDDGTMRLEWGADEGDYSGWMQVRAEGAGSSAVTVHISLRGTPPGAQGGGAPNDDQVNESLLASLRSIRNHMEGTGGGKVEPSAAT